MTLAAWSKRDRVSFLTLQRRTPDRLYANRAQCLLKLADDAADRDPGAHGSTSSRPSESPGAERKDELLSWAEADGTSAVEADVSYAKGWYR